MTNNFFREQIYDLVCGNLEHSTIPGTEMIENAFAEGSNCSNAYDRMLNAYSRLCQRLGTEEWFDPDVEVIINELMDIGKQLALKMFDYGVIFQTKNTK